MDGYSSRWTSPTICLSDKAVYPYCQKLVFWLELFLYFSLQLSTEKNWTLTSGNLMNNNNDREEIHLPFIMKVMSIRTTLSLQVHPTKVIFDIFQVRELLMNWLGSGASCSTTRSRPRPLPRWASQARAGLRSHPLRVTVRLQTR